jgi:3-methylcrotonyl-CoA carboxylase alpha subunit
VRTGSIVSHYYDPMLAKLIVYGADRTSAIARLELALQDFVIDGVRTNLPLLLWIARDEAFARGETTTRFLEQRLDESIFADSAPPREAALLCAAALLADGRAPWRLGEVSVPLRLQDGENVTEILADVAEDARTWHLSGDYTGVLRAQRRGDAVQAEFGGSALAGAVTYAGHAFNVHLDGGSWTFAFAAPPVADAFAGGHASTDGAHIAAPMPGRIVKIAVRQGDGVEEHALLIVLEAMKMEHRIEAPAAATVKALLVKEGQIVAAGTPLVELGS